VVIKKGSVEKSQLSKAERVQLKKSSFELELVLRTESSSGDGSRN
jgi:hypothetical protein